MIPDGRHASLLSLDSANVAWRTPEAGHAGGVRACAVASSVNRFVACDDRGGLVVWRPALVVEPAVEDDDAPQIRVDVALAAEADDADDFDALRREFEESRRAAAEDRRRAREDRPAEEPRRRRRRRVGDVVRRATDRGAKTFVLRFFVCYLLLFKPAVVCLRICGRAPDGTSRVADSSSNPRTFGASVFRYARLYGGRKTGGLKSCVITGQGCQRCLPILVLDRIAPVSQPAAGIKPWAVRRGRKQKPAARTQPRCPPPASTSRAARPTSSRPSTRLGGAATDEDKSIQEAMTEEVDKRMRNAVEDLREKYATGGSNVETSEHGPSGAAYRQKQQAIDNAKAKKRAERYLKEQERAEQVRRQAAEQIIEEEGVGESSDDDEYLDGLEDDGDILQNLRNKRLAQMKAQHQEKIENLQKGHGRYHEICQDDFLNDVLKSKNTLVHFYHRWTLRIAR